MVLFKQVMSQPDFQGELDWNRHGLGGVPVPVHCSHLRRERDPPRKVARARRWGRLPGRLSNEGGAAARGPLEPCGSTEGPEPAIFVGAGLRRCRSLSLSCFVAEQNACALRAETSEDALPCPLEGTWLLLLIVSACCGEGRPCSCGHLL